MTIVYIKLALDPYGRNITTTLGLGGNSGSFSDVSEVAFDEVQHYYVETSFKPLSNKIRVEFVKKRRAPMGFVCNLFVT